jgi:hypothetical protein
MSPAGFSASLFVESFTKSREYSLAVFATRVFLFLFLETIYSSSAEIVCWKSLRLTFSILKK